MDRNSNCAQLNFKLTSVALRKESVDRNSYIHWPVWVVGVALRKESVDRNFRCPQFGGRLDQLSLSARRAWIEIWATLPCFCCPQVALRKESVDRNRLNSQH